MSSLSARPKFGFSHFSVAIFLVFARNVFTSLTGNPFFMTVSTLLPNLEQLIDIYAASIDTALNRDKVKIAERNGKREDLENYMKMLAGIVMGISSDRDILLSSGFEVTNSRGPVTPVGMPEGLKYSYIRGMSGTIKLRWSRASVREASSFVVEQGLGDPNNPQTVWSVVATPTKCVCLLEDLERGTTVWWRVYGIGPMGPGGKSEPVSAMIL
ncbi:MAG: hypothetical protein SH857_04185 [Chitinophagales bacterium]|nr:hypothetical protein [Chitinophagales bacterium]